MTNDSSVNSSDYSTNRATRPTGKKSKGEATAASSVKASAPGAGWRFKFKGLHQFEPGWRDDDSVFPLPSWQFPPVSRYRRARTMGSLIFRVTTTANNTVAALYILNRSMASEAASTVLFTLPGISYQSQLRQANIPIFVSAAQRRALEAHTSLQRTWLMHSRDLCDGNRSHFSHPDISQKTLITHLLNTSKPRWLTCAVLLRGSPAFPPSTPWLYPPTRPSAASLTRTRL